MDDAASPPPPAGVRRRDLLAGGIGLTASLAVAGCTAAPPPEPSASPATGAAPPTSRPPRPTEAPGRTYRAIDGYLYDPSGALFVPIGANVGTTSSFDWKGDARGHARDALAWGWNTVRLNLMVDGAYSWSYVAQHSQSALLDLTARFVDEYTGLGIVVILDAHDNPRAKGLDSAAVTAAMVSWWEKAASAFADNPRVWSGLINEPAYTNDDWVSILDTLAAAVRGTGNPNPVLIGAPCWGQDTGPTAPYFADAKFSYDATMAPVLARRYDNLVLEQHNYGAYDRYTTAPGLGAYLSRVREAGLAPLIAEFGYTVKETDSPEVYRANLDAAQAVVAVARDLSVGALWWHATHGDHYSLKADGGAFWKGGNRSGLSAGGAQLWQLGHTGR
jgi:hypothetical protein